MAIRDRVTQKMVKPIRTSQIGREFSIVHMQSKGRRDGTTMAVALSNEVYPGEQQPESREPNSPIGPQLALMRTVGLLAPRFPEHGNDDY